MSNRNECTTTDVLETRTGVRVLANNETAAVAGAMDGLESFYFGMKVGGVSQGYLRFLAWYNGFTDEPPVTAPQHGDPAGR